jgi:putative oxidoreductase
MAGAEMSQGATRLSWICQLIVAALLGQTLFFKFTGAPESVFIFEQLGAEPWGRIGSGFFELIAVILLLWPRFAALGGVLAAGVILGAIGAHLTKLGIVVQDDGGLLFILAVVVLVGSLTIAFLRRRQLPVIGSRF